MPFRPGQSGNPSGRPKGGAAIARRIAGRELGGPDLPVLVTALCDVLTSSRSTAAERLRAAELLLDRALGRPARIARRTPAERERAATELVERLTEPGAKPTSPDWLARLAAVAK